MYQIENFLKNNVILNRDGIRLGDRLEIYPLKGRKRDFVLKRTEYNFSTGRCIS